MDAKDPACPKCKTQMKRLMSSFACPWTGTLDRFKESGKEPFNDAGHDGHWVWRVNSSRLPDQAPERQRISTRADQLRYCREEGLIMPDDINPNAEIDSDGKKLCTSGMKGQWETGMPTEAIRKTGNPWLYTDE